MRYQIDKCSVSLSGRTILDRVSMEIRGREKIGLVGANGSGKTTLLRLIDGQLSPDRDDKAYQAGIRIARNTTIGMLEQNPFFEKDQTVEELIWQICPETDPYARERYEFETEYHKIYTMFGFRMEDRKKSIRQFSGGEQTRIALIRLLLMKPDILLLDEPTNHLDLDMLLWLEGYLRSYEKAVVIVSHDRYFLDRVTDVIYELDRGSLKRYGGNYTAYRRQRETELRSLRKRYKEQQEEIEQLNQLIERFKHKPRKAALARNRKKLLDKMERIESPDSYDSYLYPGPITPLRQTSRWVYDCQKLAIGYDHPLHQMNLRIRRGQKIGIIGANGMGKSTFLKTIAGQLAPLRGQIVEGNHLDVAYYDQLTSEISGQLRLLEDYQKAHPSYTMGDCRKILARFHFRKEDVAKTIDMLSGGEKSRYVFAGLLEARPNVLLLDEPTNHLDIPSREILESAFSQYEGTILFITHDRYFLSQLADILLIFEKDRVTYYPYDYAHYIEAQQKEETRKLQGIHSMEEESLALQKSLEAVPRKTRMQSARFSTEQSYVDWQLSLIGQELEARKCHLEEVWHRFTASVYEKSSGELSAGSVRKEPKASIDTVQMDMDWYELLIYHEEYGISDEEWEEIYREYKQARELYEDCCMRWFAIYEEYEEEFANYCDM